MPKTKSQSVPVLSCELGSRVLAAMLAHRGLVGKDEFGFAELANLTGVSVERITSIVGGGGVDVRALAAIAFCLHVSTDWLLGLEPVEKSVKVHHWSTGRFAALPDHGRQYWQTTAEMVSGKGARKFRSAIASHLPWSVK